MGLVYVAQYLYVMEHFIGFLQEEFEEDFVVPLDVMPLNGVGQTFTVLKRPAGSVALGKFVNILKFKVKEIDPSSGGYQTIRRIYSGAYCALEQCLAASPLNSWQGAICSMALIAIFHMG